MFFFRDGGQEKRYLYRSTEATSQDRARAVVMAITALGARLRRAA